MAENRMGLNRNRSEPGDVHFRLGESGWRAPKRRAEQGDPRDQGIRPTFLMSHQYRENLKRRTEPSRRAGIGRGVPAQYPSPVWCSDDLESSSPSPNRDNSKTRSAS